MHAGPTDAPHNDGAHSDGAQARGGRSEGDAKAAAGAGVPTTPGQTHYQLLELSPGATATELRQAFRSLSKRYHPDTTSLPAAEAREAFSRLRQAYAVLADPASRRAYDSLLQRRRAPAGPPPVSPGPREPAASPRPIGVRRSLSGGEWFALVLLGLALVLSLILGVGLAWARGAALITRPSWWSEPSLPLQPAPRPPAPSLAAQEGIRQAP